MKFHQAILLISPEKRSVTGVKNLLLGGPYGASVYALGRFPGAETAPGFTRSPLCGFG